MTEIRVPSGSQRIVVSPNASVSVVDAGPVGPAGAQGPPGPTGPRGIPGANSGDPEAVSYEHVQGIPSTVWFIQHNLGFKPGGIEVEDLDGNQIEGVVRQTDTTELTITFSSAVGGRAAVS